MSAAAHFDHPLTQSRNSRAQNQSDAKAARTLYRIVLAVLFSYAAILQGQDKPFVRLRWKQAVVRIVYKGKSLEYNFRNPTREQPGQKPYSSLFLADITSIDTMYLGEDNGVVRMLLNIRGRSRGSAAMSGNCGAGTESALVLFQFD